ncbi:hypothetical protein Sjap_014179 [Stephania japonica]|uniref:Uncharacterized protein n=1 Tax=Stephania japonica TaxID=461633 RepID=A0AAP0J1C8_9MAGN
MMEGGGYSGGVGGGTSTKRSRSRSRSRSSGSSGDEGQMGDGGEGFRELARAVVKFGEVYERIETAKQEQLMELERQRMEVIKDVEFQRTQMFMEAQIELEKLKRAAKYSSRPVAAAFYPSSVQILYVLRVYCPCCKLQFIAWPRN